MKKHPTDPTSHSGCGGLLSLPPCGKHTIRCNRGFLSLGQRGATLRRRHGQNGNPSFTRLSLRSMRKLAVGFGLAPGGSGGQSGLRSAGGPGPPCAASDNSHNCA